MSMIWSVWAAVTKYLTTGNLHTAEICCDISGGLEFQDRFARDVWWDPLFHGHQLGAHVGEGGRQCSGSFLKKPLIPFIRPLPMHLPTSSTFSCSIIPFRGRISKYEFWGEGNIWTIVVHFIIMTMILLWYGVPYHLYQ